MQIGELLRVSADPSIYANVGAQFQDQLGLGRLDMLNALTVQPPSIRISDPALLNENGNLAQAGDQAFFKAAFINHLWPSTSGMTVTLSTENSFVSITNGQSQIGQLGTGESIQFNDQTISLQIEPDIPENSEVIFQVRYAEGAYQDFEFFSILVNPTFLNIEQNLISTTVTSIGRLGYQDFDQTNGLGFIFNERNLMFEMGFMLGTSSSQLSNTVRTNQGESDNDFVRQSSIKSNTPGQFSDFEITGSFNDDNAGSSKSNVLINYRSMTYKDSPNDHYVIIEYIIVNKDSVPHNNFFAGLYADWDLEQASGAFMDRAGWDNEHRLGFAHSATPGDDFYAGIQVLIGTPNYWAIDNDQNIGASFGVYDGFTDAEKFQSLSSGIGKEQAGVLEPNGNDISHTVGAGPFNILPGDSIKVAFAIHGASNLPELLTSAASADTMYNVVVNTPVPEVEDDTVCFGDPGTLTAQGAESYNWYTSGSGGDPIASTSQLTIENLVNDTTLFVASVTSFFETSRAKATIHVVPDPVLTVSGPLTLCPGDSVLLSVAGGDSYLWSPNGETSDSIKVTQVGIYSVAIASTSPSCSVTSENVEISQYPVPAAQFEVNRTSELEVQLSDQSTEAVSWFWDFGDGNSSLEQNPMHAYEEARDYEITLVVTSENGCVDSKTVPVAILTAIGDELSPEEITTFPNPHGGRFSVGIKNQHLGEINIGIYDLFGHEVRQARVVKSSNSLVHQFDMDAFPNGIYLLKVSFGNDVIVSRILKN